MKHDLKEIGVVLTSHPRQQLFMRQGISSYLGWQGGPIVLAYDDIDVSALPMDLFMPPVTHTVCPPAKYARKMGHAGGCAMQLRNGVRKLYDLGVPYAFLGAADTTLYNHHALLDILAKIEKEGADIAAFQFPTHGLARTEVLWRVLKRLDPDNPPNVCESWTGRQIDELGFTRCRYRDINGFQEQLGRIHVQGRYARNAGISVGDTWRVGEIWPRPDGG